MNQNQRLLTMVEISLMTALAVILDNLLPLFKMPQGGSVTLTMLPIVMIAFRRGWKAGVISGVLTGILLIIFGGFVAHPVQVVLDYPIAFGVLGLAGLIRLDHKNRKSGLLFAGFGLVIAGVLRLTAHFFSGVIFFAEYAPKGQSVYMYSFIYNLSFILPSVLISFIALWVILYKAPHLLSKNQ